MNISAVRKKILATITQCGRNPKDVTVMAVTKQRSVAEISAALSAGFTVIGENRVQEAAEKFPFLPPCERHLIGHLQKNKVRKAIQLFDCIQSVDTVELAQMIDRICGETGKMMTVFLEVNTSGDPAKFGFSVKEIQQNVLVLAGLKNIRVEGLMTIGKLNASVEETRQCFRTLRQLFDDLRNTVFPQLHHCSMGMSTDFQIALQEGATLIRIGSFLFSRVE